MTPPRDDDLDREIRAHLELEAEERRADGLGSDEARDAARRAFGNVTRVKEICYESQPYAAVARVAQDLRFALRQVRRQPGFALAAAAICWLAMGVGARGFGFRETQANDNNTATMALPTN